MIILSREDLANPQITRDWTRALSSEGHLVYPMNLKHRSRMQERLVKSLNELAGQLKSSLGIVRAVVVGLPNVGKSTLINCLRGTKVARAADQPGITRGRQWVELSTKCFLLDTPGIIQTTPRIIRKRGDDGWVLSALNLVPEAFFTPEEVVVPLIARLNGEDGVALLSEHARVKRFKTHGGDPDYDRAARDILYGFRHGKLGRVSLETPDGASGEDETP